MNFQTLVKNPKVQSLTLSLIVTAVALIIIISHFHPYHLDPILQSNLDPSEERIYHDLNKDNIDEWIHIKNRPEGDFSITVYNSSDKPVDQFNFYERLRSDRIIYGDYNHDTYDEMFVFTISTDSLFLSIINVIGREWLLERHFLLKATQYSKTGIWDVDKIRGSYLDLGQHQDKYLFFMISTGHAIYPRSVFKFNIDQRTIVNEFETSASLQDLNMWDVDADGKEEIVVTANASGNVHRQVLYGDDKCWLFVLDQALKPLFHPMSFGEFPSGLKGDYFKGNGSPHLLIFNSYNGIKSIPSTLQLLDGEGKLVRTAICEGNGSGAMLLNPMDDSIIISMLKPIPQLVRYDEELEILDRTSYFNERVYPMFIEDLNYDGNPEIFCSSSNGIRVFGPDLSLQSAIEFDNLSGFSIKHNGLGKSSQLGIVSDKRFFLMAYERNPVFSYLPAILISLFICTFLIARSVGKISTLASMYLLYFRHSFQNNPNGLLVLDNQGLVHAANDRILHLLSIKEDSIKRRHYKEVFAENPELVSLIAEGRSQNDAYSKFLVISSGHARYECEVIFRPLSSSKGNTGAFLIEIGDNISHPRTEREKIWSKFVQRIAHEIKTPLSSVVLNIRMLKERIEKSRMQSKDEIQDDLLVIQDELMRIQRLTKSFLKFADLEKPNMQIVRIKELVCEVLKHYDSYLNSRLKPIVELESDNLMAWADAQQIEFVFHILLENAIDALGGVGTISICSNEIQLIEDHENRYIEIEITDNGPGIPEDAIDSIFKPHISTKENGTGMGLAIARKIIEDHGGTIDVSSRKKLGTTFRFTLCKYEE